MDTPPGLAISLLNHSFVHAPENENALPLLNDVQTMSEKSIKNIQMFYGAGIARRRGNHRTSMDSKSLIPPPWKYQSNCSRVEDAY
jgi:hypothetical protein